MKIIPRRDSNPRTSGRESDALTTEPLPLAKQTNIEDEMTRAWPGVLSLPRAESRQKTASESLWFRARWRKR